MPRELFPQEPERGITVRAPNVAQAAAAAPRQAPQPAPPPDPTEQVMGVLEMSQRMAARRNDDARAGVYMQLAQQRAEIDKAQEARLQASEARQAEAHQFDMGVAARREQRAERADLRDEARERDRRLEVDREVERMRAVAGLATGMDQLQANPLLGEEQVNRTVMEGFQLDRKTRDWGKSLTDIEGSYRQAVEDRYAKFLEDNAPAMSQLTLQERDLMRQRLASMADRELGALSGRYREMVDRTRQGLEMQDLLRKDALGEVQSRTHMKSAELELARMNDEHDPTAWLSTANAGFRGLGPQLFAAGATQAERAYALQSNEFSQKFRAELDNMSGRDAVNLARGHWYEAYKSMELGNEVEQVISPDANAQRIASVLAQPVDFGVDGLPSRRREALTTKPGKDGKTYYIETLEPSKFEADELQKNLLRFQWAGIAKDKPQERPGPDMLRNAVARSFGLTADEGLPKDADANSLVALEKDLGYLQSWWTAGNQKQIRITDEKGTVIETINDPWNAGRSRLNRALTKYGVFREVPSDRVKKDAMPFEKWKAMMEPAANALDRSVISKVSKSVKGYFDSIPGAKDAVDYQRYEADWIDQLTTKFLAPLDGQGNTIFSALVRKHGDATKAVAEYQENYIRPFIEAEIARLPEAAQKTASRFDALRSADYGSSPPRGTPSSDVYRNLDMRNLSPYLKQIAYKLDLPLGQEGVTPWRESRGAPGAVGAHEFQGEPRTTKEWNRWGTQVPWWWRQGYAYQKDTLDLAHTYSRIVTRLNAAETINEKTVYDAMDELARPGAFTREVTHGRPSNNAAYVEERMRKLASMAQSKPEVFLSDPILFAMARFLNVPVPAADQQYQAMGAAGMGKGY